MKPKISYKNVLKASLATVVLITAFFALLIFLFGGKTTLETDLRKVPTFSTGEQLSVLESPLSDNLTQDLSKVIAKEIVDKNPNGPQPNESGQRQIAAINPEELVEKSIAEGLKNFDPQTLRGKADLTKISISNDNTLEAKAQYFINLDKIVETAFTGKSIDKDNPQLTNFKAISTAYAQVVTKLYNESTPSELTGFSIRLIETFGAQQNVYAAIGNYQDDPLLAVIASNYGDEILGEIIELSNELNVYIEENGIGPYITKK